MHLEYVTGYHVKQTYLPCRASHSRAARPTSVGSPETAGANLGPHAYYEAHFGIGLGPGHHPVDLSGPLQTPFDGEPGLIKGEETYFGQYLALDSM